MSGSQYFIASSSHVTRHPGAGDQQYTTYDASAFVDVDGSPDAFVGYTDSYLRPAGSLEYAANYTDPIHPTNAYYALTPSTEASTPDLYDSSDPDTPYTPSPDSTHVPALISSASGLPKKTRKSLKQPRKRSKKEPGHVPRPSNAFFIYRSEYARNHQGECKQDDLSVIVGRLWRAMPAKEKARYKAKAESEKKLHELRYPGYVFAPKAKSKALAASQVTGHGSTSMKKDHRPDVVPHMNPTTFLERTPVPDGPAFSSDAFVPLCFPGEAGVGDYTPETYVQTPFSAIAPSYAYNSYAQGYSAGHPVPAPSSFPVNANTDYDTFSAPAFLPAPFANLLPLVDEPYCYDPSLMLPPYNPSGLADVYIAPYSELYATDPQSEFPYAAYGNSYYSG